MMKNRLPIYTLLWMFGMVAQMSGAVAFVREYDDRAKLTPIKEG